MKLRVGNVVKVNDDSGVHSGKEGVLIPKTAIPVNDKGVPVIPGHINMLQPHEVGVKQADGKIFVIYMNKLTKISED